MSFVKDLKLYALMGLLAAALGLAVIAGWILHIPLFIQILPDLVPMQFNAALCLALSGVALALIKHDNKWFSVVFAGVSGLIAILTGMQYIIDINFGIDQLFFKHYITTKSYLPGRMAPNTVLSYIFFAVAIISWGLLGKNAYKIPFTIQLTSAIIVFAILAILGHAFDWKVAYGWIGLTDMAPHTALGFLLLGAGVCSLVLRSSSFDRDMAFRPIRAWFFMYVLIGASFMILISIQNADKARATDFFEIWQGEITEELDDVMQSYAQLLRGGTGLFVSSVHVNRQEWEEYVASLALDKNFPGIQAFAHGRIVQKDKLQDFVEQTRQEGFADFKVFPPTERDTYIVENYLEPFNEGNQSVHGFDMMDDEKLREAMNAARDNNMITLSYALNHRKAGENIEGKFIYMFQPHYINGSTINSIEERRQNIIGYIYGVFESSEVLEPKIVPFVKNKHIRLRIYDGSMKMASSLIFDSQKQTPSPAIHETTYFDLTNTSYFTFNNHVWTLEFETLPEFAVADIDRGRPALVFIFGNIIALLVFSLLWSMFNAQTQAESLAEEKVAELKKAQEKLTMLALVSQNTSDAVIITDKVGVIDWVNPAFHDLTGYTLEEVKGRRPGDFLVGSNTGKKTSAEMGAAVRNGKHFAAEIINYNKEGQEYWLDIRINPVLNDDGEIERFIAIERDITERKKIDDELLAHRDNLAELVHEQTQGLVTAIDEAQQARGFLELITNYIPDLIFVKNEKFEIVSANDSFLSIYPEDERGRVIGHTTFEHFPEAVKEAFLAEDMRAFERGTSQVYESITFADKTTKRLYTSKVRFEDAKGAQFILGVSHDVTELLETQEYLERQTVEYERAKEEAEKANLAKDDFLANMSHELRTPLNSILGLTKIILQEGGLDPEISSDLHIVDKSASSLLAIVNDILDLSKIESGAIALQKEPFNLAEVLHTLIDQMRPLASGEGLVLEHNADDFSDIYLLGDEFRLSRVLLNLLSNAVKYTLVGQVDFMASIDVATGLEKTDHNVVIFKCVVSDTGIGIPTDKLDKIFDKFTQADESTERHYGGTGLGLHITKVLTEMMGGTISVESTINNGSTFTIAIPFEVVDNIIDHETHIADGLGLDCVRRTAEEKIPAAKARILVAEDHVFNQAFIVKLIKRLGCKNFDLAFNGKEALAAFDKSSYDMVLMDVHMPEMGGYKAARAIRQKEMVTDKGAHIPIIGMTADVMPGTMEKCLEAGMDDYLSKPIDETVFRNAIANWLILDDISKARAAKVVKQSKLEPAANLSLLREYSEGDFTTEQEMIATFYNKSLKNLDVMKANQTKAQHKDWSEAAHALKGSAGYVGANQLVHFCKIAQEGEDFDAVERKSLFRKIMREHKKVCDFLTDEGLL